MKFKFLIFWTGIWILLITILTWSLFSTTISIPSELFFNILNQTDVTAEITLKFSFLRILFEPFIGLGHIFLSSTEGILSIILGYIFFRILYQIAIKKIYRIQFTNSRTLAFIERVITWFFIFILLTFIFLLILLISSWLIFKFLAIGWYGMTSIYVFTWICSITLLFFIILHLYMYFHPKSKITQVIDSLQKKHYIKRQKGIFYRIITRHQIFRSISRETRRLMAIISLIIFLNLFIMFVPTPVRMIQTDLDPNEFLFDFHVHTLRSDGFITPAGRVEWYRAQGIHGAAFSDHHAIYGALEAQKYVERHNLDFTVIIAQEYTISEPRVHLNIYGIMENINPFSYYPGIPVDSPYLPGLYMNVSETIKYVKTHGGYVTVNHYSHQDPYTWIQFRDWGIDGFEVANGGSEVSRELTQFCLDNNLTAIAGSDTAGMSEIDTFIKFRLDDPENKSLDAIFTALKRNEHEVIVVQKQFGSQSIFSQLNPDMGRYFAGLDSYQRISWITWAIATYIVSTGFYLIVRKRLNQKISEKMTKK